MINSQFNQSNLKSCVIMKIDAISEILRHTSVFIPTLIDVCDHTVLFMVKLTKKSVIQEYSCSDNLNQVLILHEIIPVLCSGNLNQVLILQEIIPVSPSGTSIHVKDKVCDI